MSRLSQAILSSLLGLAVPLMLPGVVHASGDADAPPPGSSAEIVAGVGRPRERPGPPTGSGSGSGSEPGSGADEPGEAAGPVPVVIDQCNLPWVSALPECPEPVPAAPGAPPPPPAAELVAQLALDRVTIRVPQPHTSPPEDGFQLTGLAAWFWLDEEEWRPVTARAELGGVWAEVSARPTRAVWTPGDGADPVTCTGPGRPHPGTAGHHRTACGHVYTDVGEYTIEVEVTYAVTWRASTGQAGVEAPITLTADLPIRVEQRQAVVD